MCAISTCRANVILYKGKEGRLNSDEVPCTKTWKKKKLNLKLTKEEKK